MEKSVLNPIEEDALCLDSTMSEALFNNPLNLSTPTTDVKIGRGVLTHLSDRVAVRIDKQSVGAAEVVVRTRVSGVVWAGDEISAMVVPTLVLLEFEQSAGTHSSSSSLWWT